MKTKVERIGANQNATDIILEKGKCIPVSVYIEKYGEGLSDAALGAFVRANYRRYKEAEKENAEQWKEEGAKFKETRRALNITQKEIAENIGVSPLTLGKYEQGKAVRSRRMLRQSGLTTMKYIQLERDKKLLDV